MAAQCCALQEGEEQMLWEMQGTQQFRMTDYSLLICFSTQFLITIFKAAEQNCS